MYSLSSPTVMERPPETLLRYFAANDSLHRPPPPPRKIPESALSALRGILVSSLRASDGDGGHWINQAAAPVPRPRNASGRTSPPPPPRRRSRLHVTFDSPTDRATAGTLQPLVYIYIYTLIYIYTIYIVGNTKREHFDSEFTNVSSCQLQ